MNYKEFDKNFGLNLFDFLHRFYDMATGRFGQIDPRCEKYYSISPYLYCAGNPIRYVDFRGDSISVAEQYQAQFLQDMQKIFGDNIDAFSFNDNGMLTLDKDKKEFKKGLSSDQKQIFKGLDKLMNKKAEYSVSYQSSYTTKDGSLTIDVDGNDETGGGMYYPLEKAIVVSSNITGGNVTSVESWPFKSVYVDMNTTTGLFHEFGEALAGKRQYRGGVLDYENKVRQFLGIPRRPYDTKHYYLIHETPQK
jgi:RHS repeat-associated protein